MKNTSPKLQVLISTHCATGIERVAAMSMPKVDGVGYLVVCQSEQVELPENLRNREDVEVHFIDGKGISANRNAGLRLAKAPVVLFCDDDVDCFAEGLQKVMRVFDADPTLDYAAYRHIGDDNRRYPSAESPLRPRSWHRHYPYSFEIAVRTESVRRNDLSFSVLAGINAPYLGAGEENLFTYHALEKGLNCKFFPITICRHNGLTIGARPQTPAVLRARGAVLRVLYPGSSFLRSIRLAIVLKGGFMRNLRYMLQGRRYAAEHRDEL